MTKRLFSIVAMVLFLAACGGSDTSEAVDAGSDDAVEQDNAAAEDESESESDSAAESEEPDEECDPDWDYCPNAADLLLEDLSASGLADIRNGPYEVNRDPLSNVDVKVPCAESIDPAGVFRAQSVQGDGISLFQRGMYIWDSADDLAAHIEGALATESECVQALNPELEPNPDVLLEPVEAFEVGDWSGVSFGYVDVSSGQRAGAHVQLANGDQMVFAIADTPGLAKELASSVIAYLQDGAPSETSTEEAADADDASNADDGDGPSEASLARSARFCTFFNQIDQSTGVPAGDELAGSTEIAEGLALNAPDEIYSDAYAYSERYRLAAEYALELEAGADDAELRDEYFAALDVYPMDANAITEWTDSNC